VQFLKNLPKPTHANFIAIKLCGCKTRFSESEQLILWLAKRFVRRENQESLILPTRCFAGPEEKIPQGTSWRRCLEAGRGPKADTYGSPSGRLYHARVIRLKRQNRRETVSQTHRITALLLLLSRFEWVL
jgi:hypothetical protein